MKRSPYRAKTLTGAQTRVRQLTKLNKQLTLLLERYAVERDLMAKLAADTPQFDNPLLIVEAKKIRDSILEHP